jgi:hypothetical protein
MSKVGKEPIALDYMPWADLKEEFAVGPVSFWPFYAKAEGKIADVQIREDLHRFFRCFVDNMGRPVETIVACSCGEIGFRRFSAEEALAIRAAVDCLIFAAVASGVLAGVCADNNSMAPPSADRFDLCGRWVVPSQEGLWVFTENSTSLWTHGEYHITRPPSLGGSFTGNFHPFLDALSRVFGPGFPAEVRERLFRSLEWFRFAHTESTVVSWLHKVVMMATAYEILLDFPESGKRRFFIDQIHSRLHLPESYMVQMPDGCGGNFEVCKAGEWAGQFYKLRNDIIHGDPVPYERVQYKDWITHRIVADVVMLEWVKRLLYEHKCFGDDFRRRAARWAQNFGGTTEDSERALLPGMFGLGFEKVHEALGWIPPWNKRRSRREKRISE